MSKEKSQGNGKVSQTVRVSGNGLGDGILSAQAKEREAEEKRVAGTVVEIAEGDLFAEMDFGELVQEANLLKKEEELRRMEVLEACEAATFLTRKILGLEHFFTAGDPAYVASARSRPEKEPVKSYFRILKILPPLLSGRVEVKGKSKFRTLEEKESPREHCVIPARLACFTVLAELVEPRQANGDPLRGLKTAEIAKIALSLGAVELTTFAGKKPENGRFLRDSDGHYVVLGKPGSVEQDQEEEFWGIVGKMLAKESKDLRAEQKKAATSLRELAQEGDIEDFLTDEGGGLYLAKIPPQYVPARNGNEAHWVSGGQVLFNFADGLVTIGSEKDEPFAEGKPGFVGFVTKLRDSGGRVTYNDVNGLLQKGLKDPEERKNRADLNLWHFVRRHIRWLADFRAKREEIDMMSEDGDLTDMAFLEGQPGSAVLELACFTIKKGENFVEFSPAAIRVRRHPVGEKNEVGLEVEEVSSNLKSVFEPWLGKIQREDALVGELARFVNNWKNQLRKELDDQEDAEEESSEDEAGDEQQGEEMDLDVQEPAAS